MFSFFFLKYYVHKNIPQSNIRHTLLTSQMDIKLVFRDGVVRQIKPSQCQSYSRYGSPAVCP